MEEAVHEALPVGTQLGEFRIDGVLGVGGFGITYRANDETLQRSVAIKEYLPVRLARRADDGTTVAPRSSTSTKDYTLGLNRFREEARLLARFSHPSIVGVSRFVEGNETGYLVMDLEEGQSLASRLKGRGRLSQTELLSIICPLLDALSVVHRGGYLHRDIKPANILLRTDGTPVLIDFGAARQTVLRDTTVVLTPGFAPLEQYSNREPQSPATDLYGLGATMFRCVTGIRPEAAPTRLSAHYEGREDSVLVGLSKARGAYRDDLLRFIRWMLALLARDRPKRAEQLLSRLAPLVEEHGGGEISVTPTTGTPSQVRPPRAVSNPTVTISGPSVTRSRRGRTTGPSSQLARAISDAQRQAIVDSLAQYAGPIARVMMTEELRKNPRSVEELGRRLARQLPNPADSKAFLADVRRLTRLN